VSDKTAKDKATAKTEPEREERPHRAEGAAGKGQKKKPGDAARKMRAMYKG